MWICRKCAAQVEDNFEICWSCGTSIDGALDPSFRRFERDEDVPTAVAGPTVAAANEDKLTSIAAFWVAVQAQKVQDMLEAAGVAVHIAYDFAVVTDWFPDAPVGSIHLQVAVKDVEKARRVLAEHPEEVRPLPPPPPKPPEPDEEELFRAEPWRAPIPNDLSPEEGLRFMESQLSALIDSKDIPDWKVNPAFHPDVIAFIQKNANNQGFVHKAQHLQRNRAKYFATIRAQQLAPKPAEEPAAVLPKKPPGSDIFRPVKTFARRWLVAIPLRILGQLLKWTLILLFFVVLIGPLTVLVWNSYGDKQLQDAIDAIAEQDPHWTWTAIQTIRNEKPVPDPENGAVVVDAVAQQLPDLPREEDPLLDIAASTPLDDEEVNRLRGELHEHAAVLAEAQRLAELPRGRFPIASPPDYPWERPFPAIVPLKVAFLQYRALLLKVHDDDPAAAVLLARAILNTGRSIGDEPSIAAQLVRMKCRQLACKGTERILARTRLPLPGDVLRSFQLDLESESAVNLLHIAIRGERALAHAAFLRIAAGDRSFFESYAGAGVPWTWFENPLLARGEVWCRQGWLKDHGARTMRKFNEVLDAAQLADTELPRAIAAWEMEMEAHRSEPPSLAQALAAQHFELMVWGARAYQTSQAELRVSIAALAAERYRQASHRWPDRWEDLAGHLSGVPLDPFDGQPLRLRTVDAGLEISSIGPPGQDTGQRIRVGKIFCRLYGESRRPPR